MKDNLLKKMMKLLNDLYIPMSVAILSGTLGFILSFGLGIIGAYALLSVMPNSAELMAKIPFGQFSTNTYLVAVFVCALFRGILHYCEQFFNHYIAFHVLAKIRNHVFASMRKLAPAKIEGQNKGQLLSLIMGDIENMEVFYAHTISPVMIASIVSIVLFVFYWAINPLYALLGLLFQVIVGVILPLFIFKQGKKHGSEVRDDLGELNGVFIDNIKGINETIQYANQNNAAKKIDTLTKSILVKQRNLKLQLAKAVSLTNVIISVAGLINIILSVYLFKQGLVSAGAGLITTVAMVSTFGPYINLANLGNMLTGTFASARRVLGLVDEKPAVEERETGKEVSYENLEFKNVKFSYGRDEVLKGINFKVNSNEIVGIQGQSGSGKSTLLKLIMEFWSPNSGEVSINGIPLKSLKTDTIYENMDYMTQTTELFTGTIRENLLIANENATDEELYEALKKASIDKYVRSLENGLDERVGALGDNFSGGQRQRLGLARCFLTKSKLLLLDEPTSNLDAYNEAVILQALIKERVGKTMILVSHRESTLKICDRVVKMQNGVFVDKLNI